MDVDDARHGTSAGYIAGCRDLCCWRAKLRYDKTRRLELHRTGQYRKVPAWRAVRRIQALQRLGWSVPTIAAHMGVSPRQLYGIGRAPTVYRSTFDAFAAAYDRLSMGLPPTATGGQRVAAAKARNHAARQGYAPPLAWDDIDDPDEQPTGWEYRPRQVGNQSADDDLDPVVVMRLLQGDRVTATKAEREAAVEQWVAGGGAERELCSWHGWRMGRYSAGLRVIRGGAA